jgi:hypothetical protein
LLGGLFVVLTNWEFMVVAIGVCGLGIGVFLVAAAGGGG